ncbi:MAG TPA: OsmC family protein [Actinomycetota bacterium]|nr:OsmC family protein [Actinomycetota bacterium]
MAESGTHNVGEIAGFTHARSQDQTRAAPFVLEGDEPPVLLGSNKGPNAVELLLQALAFCYAVGFVANAAARGIDITRMVYEIEGDLDVRPFLGLEGERPGSAGFDAVEDRGGDATRHHRDQLHEGFPRVSRESNVHKRASSECACGARRNREREAQSERTLVRAQAGRNSRISIDGSCIEPQTRR